MPETNGNADIVNLPPSPLDPAIILFGYYLVAYLGYAVEDFLGFRAPALARCRRRFSNPTAFTASNSTVILTIVGVGVIDVTVIVVITSIVVITTTTNNLSELAMKRSCVEALPGAVRYLHFKHAPLVSCRASGPEDDSIFRPKGQFSSFPYDGANSIWNQALSRLWEHASAANLYELVND